MARTWVVVADGARARVFEREGAHGLRELPDGNFAGSREPSRALGGDRPGRTFDSAGPARHAKQPPSDPHRLEEEGFLRALGQWLHERAKQEAYGALILVAPPRALGTLRKALPEPVARRVEGEVNADLVGAEPAAIGARLPRPPLR